ncbi:endonuclease [Halococcus saccharolyticus DSM 5350]|uniref:Endonuclease n=1 Tax=Halococcus saccharolyticus DSM 5350 TaxID=1227455 RepID=M0MK01_9EURY|nr:endonuclease [Halococcus saccharolyticus DSM 5350]
MGEESEVGEGDLSLAGLQTDADGNDNDNMNDQYLTYENTGDAPLDLTGWTVEDTSDTTYTFRRSRPIALRPPTRTRTDTRASRERTFD